MNRAERRLKREAAIARTQQANAAFVSHYTRHEIVVDGMLPDIRRRRPKKVGQRCQLFDASAADVAPPVSILPGCCARGDK